ncbi:MAG: glycosyltransferase family 9 protein [Chloroflexi bacterium]|nr:MAG: glycosyltransferase family 9 protein [Chloroflexota bacterium]
MSISVPDVHKIAVLRANGLGDFIFALPALEALRVAYPEAEIVLLGKKWHANFLANRPGPIDRVVIVPAFKGVNEEPGLVENLAEQEQFFKAMNHERFDLAIQLHGGGRYSNPFLLRLGARMTVGLKTPDAVPLDRWAPYIYFQPESIRYLEVVSLIGAKATALEPRISVIEEDLVEARRVVPEREKPLVALHPGAGDPERRWPPEKFSAVGEALATAGAHIVVVGTKEEEHLVNAVITAMKAVPQNLCGCLSLGGLASLLNRCRVLISNDSGPLHLASAVGTPTVGIYWCFNLVTAGILTRTYHHPVISWRLTCPICGIDRSCMSCDHHASFVADIPTGEVITAALDLFYSSSSVQR